MRKYLVLVLLLGLVGCDTMNGQFEKEAIGSGPLTDRFEYLWEVTRTTLEKSGFVINGEMTDHAARYTESHWVEIPGLFRGQGTRTRVIVKFVETGPESGGAEKVLGVMVRVQKQHNTNMDNPLDLENAEWSDVEPDTVRAESLIYRIKGYFRGSGSGDR